MNHFKNIAYKNRWIVLLPFLIFAISCSPAKHLSKDEYLLSKNKFDIQDKGVNEDQLKSYVLQKPNKRILWFRFHLFLYNLANPNKHGWPSSWFRRIGEAPSIYDPQTQSNSVSQLKKFLENKGYYHAEVKDSVSFKGKNAIVDYNIVLNKPYRVKSIEYFFEDTGLMAIVMPDTVHSLLHKGMIYDKDKLQQERVRIENLLKENGFFNFSKEYIYYQAKLTPRTDQVDLRMGFKEFIEGKPDPRTKVKLHPVYTIGKVFIDDNVNPMDESFYERRDTMPYDTTMYQGQYFLNRGKPRLHPSAVTNSSYIVPGQLYKMSNVNKTYRNLSELGLFKYTSIGFSQTDSMKTADRYQLINCHIDLTRRKVQSYTTEIAGTNTSGDLGIQGNILYQNWNLFRGAEVLNTKLTGAIEALKNTSNKKYTSMKEIGIESNVVFPKFFSPFRLEGFVRKYSPKTTLSASFNYQSRPQFTRSIANGSFSYKWNGNNHLTHILWPMEVNFVQIYENLSSKTYLDSIRNTPSGFSFQNHLVNVARYSMEFNNQEIGRIKDFFIVKYNIESAGNIVDLLYTTFNKDTTVQGHYKLFKVPFFQYMRSDIDLRYYNIIDKQNKFVYRLFVGLGYPYGNSKALPYEKKYFSGGPNSIRAWSSYRLGPGSYVEPDSLKKPGFELVYNTGDIKLEANIEYRFKVVWKMEGALFVDMGNIWAIRKEADRPNAEFEWNRFYKEIAVGTGFGTRFDFSFFLFRIDFGLKLHDPVSGWLPVFRPFKLNEFHVNFGIDYPF